MKKTLASILIVMMLIVSIVPAFAAPACPYEGCNGLVYRITKESRYGLSDSVVPIPHWDQEKNCWSYDYYVYTPMIREIYDQCNCNSSHRFDISTEKYLKKTYVFTE